MGVVGAQSMFLRESMNAHMGDARCSVQGHICAAPAMCLLCVQHVAPEGMSRDCPHSPDEKPGVQELSGLLKVEPWAT